MTIIHRIIRSKSNASDIVTPMDQSVEAKKKQRKRFSPSVFITWIRSKNSNSNRTAIDDLVVRERQDLPSDDYSQVAQRLCNMLVYEDPAEILENLKFLCTSSA
jgi:methionine aminopeptidase